MIRRPKTRKISRKGWVRKLDKLVSQIVIARDSRCIVCGTTKNLTCGHLFSRVAYSTRWDLDNVYAQCLSCNFRHESDPLPMFQAVEAEYLRKTNWPLKYNLKERARNFINALHRKYVTPHKYKTFELEELYEGLKVQFEKGDYSSTSNQQSAGICPKCGCTVFENCHHDCPTTPFFRQTIQKSTLDLRKLNRK